jgi:phage-related protein (TIGR01555 family)
MARKPDTARIVRGTRKKTATGGFARADGRKGKRAREGVKDHGIVKEDAWQNLLTGMGDPSRDKIMSGQFLPIQSLDYGEIESLYYGDDVAHRIVDALPDECFRRSFTLEGPDSEAMTGQLKNLDAEVRLHDALGWGRLWGGTALVLGIDDGAIDQTQPLNIEAVKGVKFINVVDRRYINPIDYYEEALSPQFGQPKSYQVTPAFGGNSKGVIIHESRLIRFWGTKVDQITTRRLAGWSYSILQRPYEVIRTFAGVFGAAAQLMHDAGQGVFKVSRLIQQLAGPKRNAILQRFTQLDMQRSSGRILLVDKEGEDFDRKPTPLAGVPDMIDRFILRLASAAEMPVTLLMGQSPAGMDATGESDMRQWYDRVKAVQVKQIEPALVKLLQILTAGKWSQNKDNKVIWAGLEEPNDKEDAETEYIEAQTWKLYSDMGAVSGEQIALIKFCDKPIEEVLDEDALAKVVEADAELMKDPPPPPPPMLPGAPMPPPPQGAPPNGPNRGPQPPPSGSQKAPPPKG